MNEPGLESLTRMINVMALSASMAILDFDMEILAKSIKHIFRSKPKVAEKNIAVPNYTYNYIKTESDSFEPAFGLNALHHLLI